MTRPPPVRKQAGGGFKLLSEEQLFHAARARMSFPEGRRSTPQRPSREEAAPPAAAARPASAPTQRPPPHQERQQDALRTSSFTSSRGGSHFSAGSPSCALPHS